MFPDDEEIADNRIIDSLAKFSEFFIPFLEKIFSVKKKFDGHQQYMKTGSRAPAVKPEDSNLKLFLTSAMKLIHGIEPKELLIETATLLMDFIHADIVNIYSFNSENQLVRVFSEYSKNSKITAESVEQGLSTRSEDVFRKIIQSGNK